MKDPRILTVKQKIKHGEITMFSQIFDIIPVEELACMLWLQEHPEYTVVPENEPEADKEIYAWIYKLMNPVPAPEVLFYFQNNQVKSN